ncbi:MAG: hypothetical protein QXE85_00050 [Nitrososphaerota archaeon]
MASIPPPTPQIQKEFTHGSLKLRILEMEVLREHYGRRLWRLKYEIEHMTPEGPVKSPPSYLFILDPEIPPDVKKRNNPAEIQATYNKLFNETLSRHASAAISTYRAIKTTYG